MATEKNDVITFPYKNHAARLERYRFNDDLFEGKHFEAFAQKVNSEHYTKQYARLKYVVNNFAGLISKVSADLLFGEMPRFILPEKESQAWLDALVFDNELHVQNYESSLGNSRRGDALYKLRIENGQLVIEDITPHIYFPHVDGDNVRNKKGIKHELAWIIEYGGQKWLRQEIHSAGLIENKLFLMEGNELKAPAEFAQIGMDLPDEEQTLIDRPLIIHVPNWKDGSRYFGYDDYSDLTSIFYAINNRVTKNENILDKHSDPILALPEGILDEEGKVKKEAFQMFEIPNDPTGKAAQKPEYITWNANLEAAFKQIDRLMDNMFALSETSPAAFGMDKQGAAESGRALKFKLMRTLAKVNRKRLYYDMAVKNLIYTSQLLAKEHKVEIMGLKAPKNATVPEIEWKDGIPQDSYEAAQEEQLRLEAGNTTVEDSIMRLDGVDRDTAKKKAAEIAAGSTVEVPSTVPTFGNEDDDDAGDE